MKKTISYALVAFIALGGAFASAQTANVSTSVSVTSSTSGQTGAGVRATGTAQMSPEMRNMRAEMEMRARAMRASTTSAIKDLRGEGKAFRASTTAAIKDMRGDYKENHAEMRMEMEARANALRASTTQAHRMMKDGDQKKRFEHASKKAHAVVERLNAAIARVQKLSDRVSERLTKLEAEGVVTTEARAHLAEAKASLAIASTQVSSIKLSIETTLAAGAATTTTKDASKDAFKNVQELVKGATKTIKEAHNHVALAISSIKPGQNKTRPATTTSVGATTTVSGSVNTQ